MELDKETQEKINELHGFEQNIHNLLIQKQAFQIELNETESALLEISKSKDDVFKLIGNIMIKANKKKIEDDLKKRKDLMSLRIKSIEKQESSLEKQAEELKEEVLGKIK